MQDQLLFFYGRVSRWVDKFDSVDVVFLYFSRLFDVVSHSVLLDMLRGLGLDVTVLSWIEDFLLGRTMRVSVSGSITRGGDKSPRHRYSLINHKNIPS